MTIIWNGGSEGGLWLQASLMDIPVSTSRNRGGPKKPSQRKRKKKKADSVTADPKTLAPNFGVKWFRMNVGGETEGGFWQGGDT